VGLKAFKDIEVVWKKENFDNDIDIIIYKATFKIIGKPTMLLMA
jgi:hypothetical protein